VLVEPWGLVAWCPFLVVVLVRLLVQVSWAEPWVQPLA